MISVLIAATLTVPHGAAWPPVPPPPGLGPPDIIPPGLTLPGTGGGSPPSTPPGPSTPAPGGPAPPSGGSRPGPQGGPSAAPTTAASAMRVDGFDTRSWKHWWFFNKAPYLDLRARVRAVRTATGGDDFYLGRGQEEQGTTTLGPERDLVHAKVVPAIRAVLERERSNDLLTAGLVALARIGPRDGEDAKATVALLSSFLANGNQEVSETAAIALGILGDAAAVDTLLALAEDRPAGRKLVGTTEVPYRTRAFAAYGLGLVSQRNQDNALRQRIAERLIAILDSPSFATRDIKVAAVTALGLTPIAKDGAIPPREDGSAPSERSRHVLSRRTQIAYLLDYFRPERAKRATRPDMVRAHAAVAIGRLLEGAPEGVKETAVPVLLDAVGRHSKEIEAVQASVALALGRIGDADLDEVDVDIRTTLLRLSKSGDAEAKRFALVGLAHIGSNPGLGEHGLAATSDCRDHLVRTLARGSTEIRPWAALSLGVLGRGLVDLGVAPDEGAATRLANAAADCRRPQEIGAYAVALGIRGRSGDGDILLEKLEFFSDVDAKGYVIVGLGLLGRRDAITDIARVLASARYKPELLWQAAVGLGLLGDPEVVPSLVHLLERARGLSSQAALAAALGIVGDARSIDPLLAMLEREDLTDSARAFAVVSLGLVCDRSDLPWNHPIADGINYLAATSTLTGSSSGILDIL